MNFTKPTSENESQSKDLFEMMQTLQDKIESLEKRIEENGKSQSFPEKTDLTIHKEARK